MFDSYMSLKFAHIAGAMIWFGGVVVLTAIHVRAAFAPTENGAGALRGADTVAAAVIRPGMMVAVVAGLGLSFLRGGMEAWERWGVAVSAMFLVLTLLFVRRYRQELAQLGSEASSDALRATVLTRRLAKLGVLNALLLLTAVWAMVYKPVP